MASRGLGVGDMLHMGMRIGCYSGELVDLEGKSGSRGAGSGEVGVEAAGR